MTWRCVPPVLSPVSPGALLGGLAAACRLRAPDRDRIVSALRRRHDAANVVLTDSGTSALILALQATVPPGGTVAYPGYGCIDMTTAALGAGVRVRLYDLDPATLSPDLDSVREAIGRGVDAIVVSHLFGYPADVSGVQRLAAEHGIPVIEDAAQGAGGTLNGKRLGNLADISILSFGRGKGTTSGSGGAVLVRTPALDEWACRIHINLGAGSAGGKEVVTLAAQWVFAHPLLYRLPASVPALRLGEMVFHAPKEPRAMTATAAMLLPAAMNLDEEEIRDRRRRANDILARTRTSSRMSPVSTIAGGESGYLRLAMLDAIGSAVPLPDLGAARGYPLTLEQHVQLQPMLAANERAGRGAAQLRDRLFTLPTHARVSPADLSRLAEWLNPPPPISHPRMSPVPAS